MLFKQIVDKEALTQNEKTSAKVDRGGNENLVLKVIIENKGQEANDIELQVGFSSNDSDYCRFADTTGIQIYKFSKDNNVFIVIPFLDTYARVYYKGSGAVVDGVISIFAKSE